MISHTSQLILSRFDILFILYLLGDGGYRGTGYITLTKMAHELLTFDFHLNDLIGYQKEKIEW